MNSMSVCPGCIYTANFSFFPANDRARDLNRGDVFLVLKRNIYGNSWHVLLQSGLTTTIDILNAGDITLLSGVS